VLKGWAFDFGYDLRHYFFTRYRSPDHLKLAGRFGSLDRILLGKLGQDEVFIAMLARRWLVDYFKFRIEFKNSNINHLTTDIIFTKTAT
jgi:hypothetical protein